MPLRRALHQLLAPRLHTSRAMDEKHVSLIEALRADVHGSQQMQQHQQAVHFVVAHCRQLVVSEVGAIADNNNEDADDDDSSQPALSSSSSSSSNAYSYSSDRGEAGDARVSLVRRREHDTDVTVTQLSQLRNGLRLLCELFLRFCWCYK